ncbi:hypothetical protein Q1695_009449 [Nippostrongylus brasiliensis]|nr:hypothetical protein Q1695_009449 [Nippostrongylus brasiliensis]
MSTNEQQPSASTPGGSGKSKKKKRDEDYVPSPPSDRGSIRARRASTRRTDKKQDDVMATILSTLQYICTKIINFFISLFYVIKFIVTKPDVAWDLISTSFHLVSVSREAGLWSFSQLWDMFYMQAIAPMIATEKAEEKANEVANS